MYGCTLQLCSWWWVQIAPEKSRANDERTKEYGVHLFVPELKMYITKVYYGTTNIKYIAYSTIFHLFLFRITACFSSSHL
jgi:hypothetical protein